MGSSGYTITTIPLPVQSHRINIDSGEESSLSGVVVSVLTTGPKGWDSNPAKAMDF
jgi:hypothetical protein